MSRYDHLPSRGWTVYTEEIPAQIIEDMPRDLAQATVRFLAALAIEVGGAVDAAKEPPGDRQGDGRYSLQMTWEPVLIEYVIHRQVREIRVPVLVWYA